VANRPESTITDLPGNVERAVIMDRLRATMSRRREVRTAYPLGIRPGGLHSIPAEGFLRIRASARVHPVLCRKAIPDTTAVSWQRSLPVDGLTARLAALSEDSLARENTSNPTSITTNSTPQHGNVK
jgi:hypothetical protein